MRHDFIDRYSRLDSPLHRLPAGLKLAAALGTVLVTAMLPVGAWMAISRHSSTTERSTGLSKSSRLRTARVVETIERFLATIRAEDSNAARLQAIG